MSLLLGVCIARPLADFMEKALLSSNPAGENELALVVADPADRDGCQAVRNACGELLVDVQHVGSTAVPDLPAKPILDIAAAVVAFDAMPELVRRLDEIGYRYRRDQGSAGGHLFVVDSLPDIRTIHLHVVEHRSSQWRDYLRFRNLLRHRPAIRKRYAELKRRLASICRDDRESYTALKADFIREILHHKGDGSEDSGNQGPGE